MLAKLKRRLKWFVSGVVPRVYFLPGRIMVCWLDMEFFL